MALTATTFRLLAGCRTVHLDGHGVKSGINRLVDQFGILFDLGHATPNGLVFCATAVFIAHFCARIRDNRKVEVEK